MPRVFTPASLAREWQCSERHVRNLIAKGELQAFKLGGKLWRISAQTVEEYERSSTEENSPPKRAELEPS